MNYIVKNCPSRIISPNCCAKYHIDNGHAKDCQDIVDCVIKQVIEKCKNSMLSYSKLDILRTACETNQAYGKAVIAEQILQLFDIEEINK